MQRVRATVLDRLRQVERLRPQRLVLQCRLYAHRCAARPGPLGRCGHARRPGWGAEFLATRAACSPEEFCQRVVSGVSDRVGHGAGQQSPER